MALHGEFVSLKFDRYESFDWTNAKGISSPIRKLVGLMEFGDGRRDWVEVGWPRNDDTFQAPKLTKGTLYMIPVLVGVNRKQGKIQYTFRTDMQPFETPEMA